MIKDNTIKTGDNIDIYTNHVYELVDQYIDDLDTDDRDALNNNPSKFMGLIYYIKHNIEKIDNDNIDALNAMFSTYIDLCCKYNILPTIQVFSILVSINNNTISDWCNGAYRSGTEHSLSAKNWKETCKTFLINHLSNSKGADINKIFIAKANYGMVETAPMQLPNEHQIKTVEQIAQEYGESTRLEDKSERPNIDF